MYVEKLQTPHPANQLTGLPAEPFTEAAGLWEARQYLSDHPGDNGALFEVVDHVTDTVRGTLQYFQPSATDKDEMTKELLTFDAIEGITTEQVTHCAGLTIVGSEAFEAIGVEHYIGYMSGHWFLLAPYEEGGKQHLQLVDMYKPEPRAREGVTPRDIPSISQDIANALSHPGVGRFVETLRRGDPISAKLDFRRFAKTLGEDISTWDYGDYRWLDPYIQIRSWKSETSRPSASAAYVMTAFAPVEGREVAEQHTLFEVALARGEAQRSVQHLSTIAGRFPEINARAPHDDIRSLVMALCIEEKYRQAANAIDGYFGYGRAVSRDSRLAVIEGDLWRHVTRAVTTAGVGIDSDVVRDRAANAYKTAASRTSLRGYQAMCIGKLTTL